MTVETTPSSQCRTTVNNLSQITHCLTICILLCLNNPLSHQIVSHRRTPSEEEQRATDLSKLLVHQALAIPLQISRLLSVPVQTVRVKVIKEVDLSHKIFRATLDRTTTAKIKTEANSSCKVKDRSLTIKTGLIPETNQAIDLTTSNQQ